MSPPCFDAIVVGLGAVGSAATYHLAKSGQRVLGLDQFAPPHTFGSSHGQTRIIREAYYENPAYVPLVQRAYSLWSELAERSARHLLTITGGLMIGRPDGLVFPGAQRSAQMHCLPHQILSSHAIRQRFPALTPDENMAAIWEPRAGILFPEACIQAHLDQARLNGAALRLNEPVVRWAPEGPGVRVTTTQTSYSAGQLLLTVGAWTSDLLRDLNLPLLVERQVLHWFDPEMEADRGTFCPANCPIHLWETDPGRFFYGFPDLGDGIKVAQHHEGRTTHPDHLDRSVAEAEIEAMRLLLFRFLPKANGTHRSSVVCMYTNTPDGHFLMDRHPELPQVFIASPCSGHGFKFASALGEALAGWLTTGEPTADLNLFSLKRFTP